METTVAYWTKNTEHGGPKNRGAKSGYWGYRAEAKEDSRHGRRQNDKGAVRNAVFETEEWKALPPHIRAAFEWTLETHDAAYRYLAHR
jgi:hypothetical protein